MKKAFMIISLVSLVMLIVPPFGVYLGKVELEASKTWMFIATILWFATAPFWMGKKEA